MNIMRLLSVGLFAITTTVFAGEPLAKSVFKQVLNNVSVVDAQTLVESPAQEGDVFLSPNLVKTGRKSRAQLVADDGTITRVGSNTIFSFDENSRTVNLRQGNILFNSPKGKGGGKIVTASASATVLGTTLAVSATPNGGFKCMCLEGQVQIQFPNGVTQNLNAGQMTFVMPSAQQQGQSTQQEENAGEPTAPAPDPQGEAPAGERAPGEQQPAPAPVDAPLRAPEPLGEPGVVLNFDLGAAVEGASLIGGFTEALPSQELIKQEVTVQRKIIRQGGFQKTGLAIVEAPTNEDIIVVDAEKILDVNPDNPNGSTSGLLLPPKVRDALNSPLLTLTSSIPEINKFTGTVVFSAADIFSDQFKVSENPTDAFKYYEKKGYHGILGSSIDVVGVTLRTGTHLSFKDFYGATEVILAAKKVLKIAPTTTTMNINGLTGIHTLRFIAGSISVADGLTVNVNFSSGSNGLFGLYVVNALGVNNLTFQNTYGGAEFYSQSGLKVSTGTFDTYTGGTSELSFQSGGDIVLSNVSTSARNLIVGGSRANAVSVSSSSLSALNQVTLRASRTLTLNSTNVYGKDISSVANYFNAAAYVINLTGSTDKAGAPTSYIRAQRVSLNGQLGSSTIVPDSISVKNYNFAGLAAASIQARTVNLENIAFPTGSVVSLKSAKGVANFGSSVPYYVNFIKDVKYGGTVIGENNLSSFKNIQIGQL